MKKRSLLFIFVLAALVSVFVTSGCDINNPVIDEWWVGETPEIITPAAISTSITTYTVTFDMVDDDAEYFDAVNGNKTEIMPQSLGEGALVSEPGLVIIDDNPDDGHHDNTPVTKYFGGWYTDPLSGGIRWIFNKSIVNNISDRWDGKADKIISLYARWSDSGSTVTFYPGGDFDQNDILADDDDDDEIDWSDTIYPVEPEYVAPGVELSQPKGFGLKPDDPLADSYTFTGWYKDVNGNKIVDKDDTKWDFNTPVTDDMDLYAGWGTKTPSGVVMPENGGTPTPVYTVTFNSNGGSPVPAEKVLGKNPEDPDDPGNPVPRPDAIYRGTDAFGGWYTDASFQNKWDFDTTIDDDTYDMADGNDDNTFTLYANWVPTEFTVRFDMQGGEYFDGINGTKSTIEPQLLGEDELVQEPGLVIIDNNPNDGHHDNTPVTKYFGGWYTAPETGGTPWKFNENTVNATTAALDGTPDAFIDLYARWSDTGSTVTFYPGGDFDQNGTLADDDDDDEIDWSDTIYPVEPEYVATDVELSQPKGFGLKPGDPLADSYTFTGWYIDKNNNKIVDEDDTKWDFNTPVTDNMNLYAGWGTKTPGGVVPPENGGTPTPVYTVIFEADDAIIPDGETKAAPNEAVLTGNTVPMPDAIYKDLYTFVAWYKDQACTKPWDFTKTVDEADDRAYDSNDDNSFTLYAKWTPSEYSDLWFKDPKNCMRTAPLDNDFFPFQCGTSGRSEYDFSEDQSNGGISETDLNNNYDNLSAIVDLLNDDGGEDYIVRIVGSGSSDTLIAQRELQTWYNLCTDGVVNPEQVVINTKLPDPYAPPDDDPPVANSMIFGNNPTSSDLTEPDTDEVKIYLYLRR